MNTHNDSIKTFGDDAASLAQQTKTLFPAQTLKPDS